MPVVQNERLFVFERISFQFIRHFAKRILDESSLQHWLAALCPTEQNRFNAPHLVPLTVSDHLARDCLRGMPERIKAFRSAAPVDARITFHESFSGYAAALVLVFHFFFIRSVFLMPLQRR